MGYKTTTIAKMMQDIERNQTYLPAIQRKFVWTAEKMARLMDSIMHDYPFGTFLFWKVTKRSVNDNRYALYKFINTYDERTDNNNELVNLPLLTNDEEPEREITAVLDGQQRLTSLCIILGKGITVKTPKTRKNNPNNYLKKDLYFDLNTTAYVPQELRQEQDDANAEINAFDFLTSEEADKQNASGKTNWYKVKEVVAFPNDVALKTHVRKWDEIPYWNVVKLYQKIMQEDIINYFEIEDQASMDEVLEIFVRVNSAGTVLSKTDLLFSTVVASWEHGREEFDELLKQVNGIGNGFKFPNDFLLQTSAYLIGLPTALKVELLKPDNVNKIRQDWENIKKAILDTVYLLNELGFNGENISSYNSVEPVVYYRYQFGEKAFDDDSVKIELRKYIVLAHLNQIYGRSTNSTLSIIRNEINKHFQGENKETFKLSWFQSVKFTGDATLLCSKETIEKWFDEFEKGPQTFMVLSLLYPNLQYDQVKFHQDHMYPYSAFDHTKELKNLTLPNGETPNDKKIEEWKKKRNTLANLQLLEGGENQSKKDTSLEYWLVANKATVKYLPDEIDFKLENFDEFLEKRKKLMVNELVKILGATEDDEASEAETV